MVTEKDVFEFISSDPGASFSMHLLAAHFKVSPTGLYKLLNRLTESGRINHRQFGQRRVWSVPAPAERYAKPVEQSFRPLSADFLRQHARVAAVIRERALG